MPDRLANATLSYARYFLQAFWPGNLAVYYPFPATFSVWGVAGAALLLVGISVAAVLPGAAMALFGGGLAVVFGNAAAGDWADSTGRLLPCGPLHLRAADRGVCRVNLGRGRAD